MRISDWSSDVCSSDLLAASHDKIEPAPAFCEQPDVRQRVAVHHQKVGVRAGRDAAEFAVLHQNLGSDGCRLSQNLDWRKYLAADRELAALLNIGLAEEIGAEADLHARGPHMVQAFERGQLGRASCRERVCQNV